MTNFAENNYEGYRKALATKVTEEEKRELMRELDYELSQEYRSNFFGATYEEV